jgi:hypothetical protein
MILMNAVQTSVKSATREGDRLRVSFPLEEFVPIGTFAGSQDVVLRIRNGKPIPANTGDQGGGQN